MLIIGQQSAYTGSLMKIESVLWSVRNRRSGAVREGKIPNGVETPVKPPLLITVRPRLTLGDLAGYEIDTGKVHACKELNMALRN